MLEMKKVICFLAVCALASSARRAKRDASTDIWTMPDEGMPHKQTWMAFGATEDIWGPELLPGVRQNLCLIASTIVKYEPVSMLVREEEVEIARSLCDSKVNLVVSTMNDLWMRDTGPVFVKNAKGKMAGVQFNFNGWGNKKVPASFSQPFDLDAKVAEFITTQENVERIVANLVLEGGGIEVDGEGTAIITESCTLNANRNPGVSKAEFEARIKPLLGLEKIIWLPGIAGKDITDGHTDFYARFASPGVVVATLDMDPESFDYAITRTHLQILNSSTDAKGRKLQVNVIEGPVKLRTNYTSDTFCASYINFYVAKGAVISPQFGDAEADRQAKETLAKVFSGRVIEQLNIDAIAAGGGGIHCTTQQEPLLWSSTNKLTVELYFLYHFVVFYIYEYY